MLFRSNKSDCTIIVERLLTNSDRTGTVELNWAVIVNQTWIKHRDISTSGLNGTIHLRIASYARREGRKYRESERQVNDNKSDCTIIVERLLTNGDRTGTVELNWAVYF